MFSYSYDMDVGSVGDDPQTIVTGMDNTVHVSRTLLYPRKVEGMLVVSRGSPSNLDYSTASIERGAAQVRAFNLSDIPDGGYDYNTEGLLLAYGVRNEVGLVEHPETGGLFGVENSADELERGTLILNLSDQTLIQ